MQLVNCWEFFDCPGERRKICSAFKKKAGRMCWTAAGTLCGGSLQVVAEDKIDDCRKCDFYILVNSRRV